MIKIKGSLSKQQISDNIREEKINKLSVELRECVAKKKREFEQSYRNDCETFGFVTQKLVEKDKTLEDRLKVALLETMKDLQSETMKKFDEFLDQIYSFNCN
uniref:Periphilin-1 C-terminal domain-containing protein n=1 Tax=Meloidogyne incognita TaxID=6306 RepID=A0A914P2W3_MELIC